jgi:hypothetical protein
MKNNFMLNMANNPITIEIIPKSGGVKRQPNVYYLRDKVK